MIATRMLTVSLLGIGFVICSLGLAQLDDNFVIILYLEVTCDHSSYDNKSVTLKTI